MIVLTIFPIELPSHPAPENLPYENFAVRTSESDLAWVAWDFTASRKIEPLGIGPCGGHGLTIPKSFLTPAKEVIEI